MPRHYHLLLTRGTPALLWSIEFGDHDIEAVKFERQDYRDHDWKASCLKIVTAKSVRVKDCEDAVRKANNPTL